MKLVHARRVSIAALSLALISFSPVSGQDDPADRAATPASAEAPTSAPGSAATPAPTEGLGELTSDVEWEQCPFQPPAGIDIECGALNVPANREDPGSGVVRLRFGVVRAGGDINEDADAAARSPIVYLSGGPGGAALQLVPLAFGRVYGPLARDRDLIILDQRGTGFSQPSLFCDEYLDWAIDSLDSELQPAELAEEAAGVLEECRQRLLDEGVDLSDFDSEASAADLEDLRQALGHDEWNLYGLSYGTRLALTAMRANPEGIRSVVLDAAYPVEANVYTETPDNLARAMDAFFAACTFDPACSEQFPDLESTFRDLVAELNEDPASVAVLVPTTGQQVTAVLTGDALVGFLFQSLYLTDLIQFLPEIIAAAGEGEFGTIGLLLGAYTSDLAYVSIGQQLAVQCNEEVAFVEEGELEAAAAEHPLLEGFYTSAPNLGPLLLELCESWAGADGVEAVENEAVTSDIPTLIMTGALDPITPPRWGEAVEQNLTNATFHEFPYTGHGVVPARDCAAAMVQDFLADPEAEVDASCIEQIPAPPFTADEADVEMVPYTSPAGFEGLRPETWDEVLPGVFQESPLVALIQQVLPGATEQVFLQQVAGQLGLSETPQPAEALEGDQATWNRYQFQNLGQEITVALTEHDGSLLVVQLATPPLRHEVYVEQAFRPAVEAFQPATGAEDAQASPNAAMPAATPVPVATTVPAG